MEKTIENKYTQASHWQWQPQPQYKIQLIENNCKMQTFATQNQVISSDVFSVDIGNI